jgi:hypothetical protein
MSMHAETLMDFDVTLVGLDGRAYHARACGRQREDAFWEGWVEFDSLDGELELQTHPETTLPNLATIQYWASGLSRVYLESALVRAVSTTATA